MAVTDDGRPILKDGMMREALAAAARVGLTRDPARRRHALDAGRSMNLGPVSFKLGLRGMPAEAESSMVERDIRLVAELRDAHPHLHVAHTSTAAALAAVRQARRNGLRVTCEVAPHHFLLTEEHVGLYNTHAKMNPPLRSAADRDAMIEGILDGVVDAIATDHAPHAMHEKEIEFELRAQRDHRPGNRAWPVPALAAQGVEDAAGPRAEPAERAARGAAGIEGPRNAGRGQLCRCGGLRSQSGVDLPRDGVEIEGQKHAVRRMDDAGQDALDGQ